MAVSSTKMSQVMKVSMYTACNTSRRNLFNRPDRFKSIHIAKRSVSSKYNNPFSHKQSKILKVIGVSASVSAFAYVTYKNLWVRPTTVRAESGDGGPKLPTFKPIRSVSSADC